MASTYSARIELLNIDNFDSWKLQVKALLVKNDAWLYVKGLTPRPEPLEGDVTRTAAIQAWDIADLKAQSDLILAISPSELK